MSSNVESASTSGAMSLAGLYEQLKSVEAAGSQLDNINRLSRPNIRPLHILDLSDEILTMIAEFARGWWPEYDCSAELELAPGIRIKNIQNLRLSCSRFCNASSRFLLPIARVKFNSLSLSQLEEISLHPTISKGVSTIQVIVPNYNSTLANDFTRFANYNLSQLQVVTNLIKSYIAGCVRNIANDVLPHDPSFSEDRVRLRLAKIEEFREMLKSWRSSLEDSQGNENSPQLEVLKQSHEKYQTLSRDQENLCQSGLFVRAIGNAYRRMPVVSGLVLQNGDLEDVEQSADRIFRMEERDYHTYLIDTMLLPLTSMDFQIHGLEISRMDIFLNVPKAILNGGGPSFLGIWIQESLDFSDYAPWEEEPQNLSSAVGRLKSLCFIFKAPMSIWWEPRKPEDYNHLGKFLSNTLNTDSIENMTLNLQGFDNWERVSFSLGSLIKMRPWPRLTNIVLTSVPFHLTELQQLLDNLPEEMDTMAFSSNYLLSGTWKETLDALRNKSQKIIHLRQPLGADIRGLFEEWEKAIFGGKTDLFVKSRAEKYILGEREQNPLIDVMASDSEED